MKRVNGETIISPDHNYIVPITDTSDTAWQQTLRNLDDSQIRWTTFLSTFSDNALSDIYPANGHTHYEHIHGIIQHDAYHLGQIVLLSKHPDL